MLEKACSNNGTASKRRPAARDTATPCTAPYARDAEQEPPRGDGIVPLGGRRKAPQGVLKRFASSTADLTCILSNTRARCTSTVRTLMSS